MAVYLSMGSNIGDREGNLREATRLLSTSDGIRVTQSSRIYETDPVGEVEQGDFLNMAVAIETELEPLGLLERLKSIETAMGRETSKRWGPRLIDIDIVLWEGVVYQDGRLAIPHPSYRERGFVLTPLAEIAPNVVDPTTGRTVKDLEAACHDEHAVRVISLRQE